MNTFVTILRHRWNRTLAIVTAGVLYCVACANVRAGATTTVSGSIKVLGAKSSANVVVYLEPVGRTLTVEPPREPVVVDQRQKQFTPFMLPILKGTTVTFVNNDDFMHDVRAMQDHAMLFVVMTPAKNSKVTQTFNKPGLVALLCDFHPEMLAYIAVLETPYFSTTDEAGKFTIANVPYGQYTVKTMPELRSEKGQAALAEGISVNESGPAALEYTVQKKK